MKKSSKDKLNSNQSRVGTLREAAGIQELVPSGGIMASLQLDPGIYIVSGYYSGPDKSVYKVGLNLNDQLIIAISYTINTVVAISSTSTLSMTNIEDSEKFAYDDIRFCALRAVQLR